MNNKGSDVDNSDVDNKIQSDDVYDITSPSNYYSRLGNIDIDHLKNTNKKINNVTFNSNNFSVPVEEYMSIGDEATPLGTDYTFKYAVGSKKYFLKSVGFGPYRMNNNDILFETLDSPYIAKVYRVLYDHVVLKDGQSLDKFWVLTEFLDISIESLGGEDMDIIRQIMRDTLNGLIYLQSQGIQHDDMHLENVQGRRINVGGKTEYRFKIIDFCFSYSHTGANSLKATQNMKEYCSDLPPMSDLYSFTRELRIFATPSQSEKPAFDEFMYECEKEASQKKPDMKRLLKHPFMTIRAYKSKTGPEPH